MTRKSRVRHSRDDDRGRERRLASSWWSTYLQRHTRDNTSRASSFCPPTPNRINFAIAESARRLEDEVVYGCAARTKRLRLLSFEECSGCARARRSNVRFLDRSLSYLLMSIAEHSQSAIVHSPPSRVPTHFRISSALSLLTPNSTQMSSQTTDLI